MKAKKEGWIKVNSSNLSAIMHEKNTLFIRFNSHRVYSYTPFTEEQYHRFFMADSKGKHFRARIQNNKNLTVKEIK